MTPPEQVTIDVLSERARVGGDVDAQSALWRAMFALDEWWFMATGGPPDGGPAVGIVDGVAALLAFTSKERARAFALANGHSPEQASQVIAIPGTLILEMCEQLAAQGVERLVVDLGSLGFSAPLDQLRPMHGFIHRAPEL